jgi:hypothetical protein
MSKMTGWTGRKIFQSLMVVEKINSGINAEK